LHGSLRTLQNYASFREKNTTDFGEAHGLCAAVEMLKDNASPKAGALYAALDMPFAGLVGQLAEAFAKGRPT